MPSRPLMLLALVASLLVGAVGTTSLRPSSSAAGGLAAGSPTDPPLPTLAATLRPSATASSTDTPTAMAEAESAVGCNGRQRGQNACEGHAE